MNRRDAAKARTRAKTIAAAQELWATPGSYEIGTIRDLARKMQASTGSVFANFTGKDDVWKAAFPGRPVPVDSALTRAASDMRVLLEAAAPLLRQGGYPLSAEAIDDLLASIDGVGMTATACEVSGGASNALAA